jgi:hypothetical protein
MWVAMGFVLVENVRMFRSIAGLYGGRPGVLGALRLGRLVVGHLIATGGIAMTDDLLGQFVGQDVLRRLSRRLGEGAFNGALTARLGVVAVELATGEIHSFHTKALFFATGGFGRIFKTTSNAYANTGDGPAVLARRGVPLQDMEFFQFHPTGIRGLGILNVKDLFGVTSVAEHVPIDLVVQLSDEKETSGGIDYDRLGLKFMTWNEWLALHR